MKYVISVYENDVWQGYLKKDSWVFFTTNIKKTKLYQRKGSAQRKVDEASSLWGKNDGWRLKVDEVKEGD